MSAYLHMCISKTLSLKLRSIIQLFKLSTLYVQVGIETKFIKFCMRPCRKKNNNKIGHYLMLLLPKFSFYFTTSPMNISKFVNPLTFISFASFFLILSFFETFL